MPRQSDAFLIEASWEVCNKVGGIHTVVTSKLAQARQEFGDSYLTVGPYLTANSPEFRESDLPVFLKKIASDLEGEGVLLHYGVWKPFGQPTVLIDSSRMLPRLNDLKHSMWERFQLDTLGTSYYDVDQPLLWAYAVGLLAQKMSGSYKVTLQLHEWLSAGAIMALDNKEIHTVFTTHATVLGRALSSTRDNLYANLASIDPDQEAARLNVTAKHQLERIGAQRSSVFTVVSQLTGQEAAALLGRAPDVITENGLNLEAFPTFELLSASRLQARALVEEFLASYFFPSYTFDLDRVFLQFTMGRLEMTNKGYDIYLRSLAELNSQMKASGTAETVVSFILVPAGALGIKPAVSSQLLLYRQLQERMQDVSLRTRRSLFRDLCERGHDAGEVRLGERDWEELTDIADHIPRPLQPPISPFVLANEEYDPVIRLCRELGLENSAGDRVKVVYMPVYLDGFDGIFNRSLYSLVTAFDLGVFPSKYEPWGYTPMESIALGVPAITSNLAGFGRSLAENRKVASTGAFVLDRELHDEDSQAVLTGQLASFQRDSARERTDRRIAAYQASQTYSWQRLYAAYRRAYAV